MKKKLRLIARTCLIALFAFMLVAVPEIEAFGSGLATPTDLEPSPSVSNQPAASSSPTVSPSPTAAPAANDMENAKVSSIKNQAYTGQAIQPKLTVKLNGKKLKEGSDYTVKWKKNKDIGTAKVTIKGKGKYKGSKEVTFKIIPAAVNLKELEAGKKKLTVEWEKGSKADGYEIEYSRKKDFSDSETVSVKGAGKTSKVIKKLKKGKNYYVRVRAYKKSGGKTYYSKWSKSMKKKVK